MKESKDIWMVDLILHIGAGFETTKFLNELHIIQNHHFVCYIKMFQILAWVLTKRKFSSNIIVDPERSTTKFLQYFVINAVGKIVICSRSTWTRLSVEVNLLHRLTDIDHRKSDNAKKSAVEILITFKYNQVSVSDPIFKNVRGVAAGLRLVT